MLFFLPQFKGYETKVSFLPYFLKICSRHLQLQASCLQKKLSRMLIDHSRKEQNFFQIDSNSFVYLEKSPEKRSEFKPANVVFENFERAMPFYLFHQLLSTFI